MMRLFIRLYKIQFYHNLMYDHVIFIPIHCMIESHIHTQTHTYNIVLSVKCCCCFPFLFAINLYNVWRQEEKNANYCLGVYKCVSDKISMAANTRAKKVP